MDHDSIMSDTVPKKKDALFCLTQLIVKVKQLV